MDIGIIAKRYAKALLDFALISKTEDQVYAEVLQFIESWGSVPLLAQVLGNPLLPNSQKEMVICQAASTTVSPTFQKFTALVVAHRRESFMLFIAHSYVTLYRKLKHISIGKLITAVPVNQEVSSRLEKMVKEQSQGAVDVLLDAKVDPSIMGGFIFQIDDLRLDASVRSQFEQIKKQFVEKNKRII
ncbi:MAG: F0F1 ATP synthase subunit delta [Bacteroidales bacterium]|jgi:F-type H+-transporting ATPase subunit delta|nr:F0F1 ATP synthase subunit delta [Bacteroidales bacterium]MCR5361929.1 F0F1 ATP synthase subunit delta [Bacteroidales bacterium]